ncbi:hypothetical protein [Faecalibaculum rodentium]|uniref:hypothetical protein n=1 Tax=Faecalibaculum rodentium TaxID=1702221 RepID=UPI001F55CEB7|nr:hypothetical protein [Faecalibaculum rodentium]
MTDLDKIAIMLEAGSPECACMKCEECPLWDRKHEECVLVIDADHDARRMRVKGIIIEAVMEWADGLAMEFMYRRMKEGDKE